jgi:hypothetical protein
VQNGVAVVGGGSDVEEGQLVRTFVVVAFGNIDGVACIAQTEKVYAFDDAAVFDVETGDDAFCQCHFECLSKTRNEVV